VRATIAHGFPRLSRGNKRDNRLEVTAVTDAGVLDPVSTDELDGLSAVALPDRKAMAIVTCDPNEAAMMAGAELIPPPEQPGAYDAADE
jgi:hypothetical protein